MVLVRGKGQKVDKRALVISESFSLAHWASRLSVSKLQTLLSATLEPDILSFALGLPDSKLFPIEALARASSYVLTEGRTSLQYAPELSPLKKHIADLMRLRGVVCSESNIFLTAGAQQGLNLLARLLLNPHDSVLLEEYSYSGFHQAVQHCEPNLIVVPTDMATGIDVDAVEHKLKSGPRPVLIYVVPEGHNPTATSISYEKRARLVDLARKWRVPIIEDDAYGFLQYEPELNPAMRALDDSLVLYVGSFSKILAPSLRVGWIVAPQRMMAPLSVLKESTDINTATLSQRIVFAYLETCDVSQHLLKVCQTYRQKRDCMANAIYKHPESTLRFNVPRSGVFLWVDAGEDVDSESIFRRALFEERVAILPGMAFSPTNHVSSWFRLNFSHPSMETIDEGISKLTRVLR